MSSIVQELQKDSLSNSGSITDLLRKAYFVAKKLKQNEFIEWLERETNGYPHNENVELPSYRKMKGRIMVHNPYHGHQPVTFQNPEEFNKLSTHNNYQPVSELEHIFKSSDTAGTMEVHFSPETAAALMKAIGFNLEPTLHIQPSAIYRIIDSLRNTILKWSLRLEEDGILGNNLSFSKEEILKASSPTYNISNFFGDVKDSQIQLGTSGSSQQFVKKNNEN